MTQHAETCPVCEGKTTMPASFYDDLGNDGLVECRSCKGNGYIVLGVPDYPVWQPAPWPSTPTIYPFTPWTFTSDRTQPMTNGKWVM